MSRQYGDQQKVILMFNRSPNSNMCYTEWYDPATKLRKKGPEIRSCIPGGGPVIIRDKFVLSVGMNQSVNILDLSSQSPCSVPMIDMLVKRRDCVGVGVIDDCLYTVRQINLNSGGSWQFDMVGGQIGSIRKALTLTSAEVLDFSSKKWRKVSNMSSARHCFGIGVLNNCLYSVGGYTGTLFSETSSATFLKSVERYDPTLDTWTCIEDMSVSRPMVCVGVLNGILYAIGGFNGSSLKSAEAFNPTTGVWSPIADMHLCRYLPGVVVFDGLLYVIGGYDGIYNPVDSLEIYNPITNSWVMEEFSRSEMFCCGGVVVDKPSHFTAN